MKLSPSNENHFARSWRMLWLAALLVLGSVVPSWAGAPAPAGRLDTLPGVCADGPRRGRACRSGAECPRAHCAVDFENGRRVEARMTMMIDDDVSRFDGTEEHPGVVAATVLLEIRRGDRLHLLSQTYQNLAGEDLEALLDNLAEGPELADTGNSGNRVTEAGLQEAVAQQEILDDLLFQEGDSSFADAVRGIFRASGRPVVVRVNARNPAPLFEDRTANGLASVLRAQLTIRFVDD